MCTVYIHYIYLYISSLCIFFHWKHPMMGFACDNKFLQTIIDEKTMRPIYNRTMGTMVPDGRITGQQNRKISTNKDYLLPLFCFPLPSCLERINLWLNFKWWDFFSMVRLLICKAFTTQSRRPKSELQEPM